MIKMVLINKTETNYFPFARKKNLIFKRILSAQFYQIISTSNKRVKRDAKIDEKIASFNTRIASYKIYLMLNKVPFH